jgi:hypothetical protein
MARLLACVLCAALLLIALAVLQSSAPTPIRIFEAKRVADVEVSTTHRGTASSSHPPPSPAGFPAGVRDATCHARLHTDYMGESAPVWGLGQPGFHLATPADCCAACQAHAATCSTKGAESASWWPARPELRCGRNPGCNIWVFCPEERCFAFDIHVHERGECWLKHQRANITRPKDPHEGHTTFPEAMRRAPRQSWPWPVDVKIWPGEIPVHVSWVSGVLAPAGERVVSAPADDRWRRRWCEKHQADYGPCDLV